MTNSASHDGLVAFVMKLFQGFVTAVAVMIVFAMASVSFAGHNTLRTYITYGAGTSACGDWTKAATTQKVIYETWILGYMSGYENSVATRGDVIELSKEIAKNLTSLSVSDQKKYIANLEARESRVKRDKMAETTSAAMSVWMDNYCQENPLDRIKDGVQKLVSELQERHQTEYPL